MSQVKAVTSEEFEREVLTCELPVVVDFHASWCGPCKMLAPILESVAASYEGKIKFVKVDVDEEPSLAEACDISSVPTLVTLKDGRVVDRVEGLMSLRALEAKLSWHASLRTLLLRVTQKKATGVEKSARRCHNQCDVHKD